MAERVEQTREALISTARDLFGQRGFAAVGVEEIVRSAGLTRADDGGRTKREVTAAVDRYLDALLGAGRRH